MNLGILPRSIVIGGPSYGGKTTLVNYLVDCELVRRGITCTTRPQRDQEPDDAYDFLTETEFDEHKSNGRMAEETLYIGNEDEENFNPWRYGILQDRIDEAVVADLPTMWVLDARGAREMGLLIPNMTSIFLWASGETLVHRGFTRAGETLESIGKRLKNYDREIAIGMTGFDYNLRTDKLTPVQMAIGTLTIAAMAVELKKEWVVV